MEFDAYGNLTPYSLIKIDVDTFRQQFVEQFPFSTKRSWLFDVFLSYMNDVKQIVKTEVSVWVDGSFITRKPEPKDIDFVVFIDYQVYYQFEQAIEQIRQRRFLENSGIDGYFVIHYPEGHRRRNWFESDQIRWLHDFGTSLANRKKGIVQLSF